MARDTDERLLAIIQQLLDETITGMIGWAETDDPATFFFSGSRSTVLVSAHTDEEGDRNVRLRVLNDSGKEVASMRSTWVEPQDVKPNDPWATSDSRFRPGPNNKLLDDLAEAARRSALRIDEVLDSLANDLDTNIL